MQRHGAIARMAPEQIAQRQQAVARRLRGEHAQAQLRGELLFGALERGHVAHEDLRRVAGLERSADEQRHRAAAAVAGDGGLEQARVLREGLGEEHQVEAALLILERAERHQLAAPRARLAQRR